MARIEIDDRQARRLLTSLQRAAPRIQARAINRAAAHVNTQTVRRVSKEVKLPQKFIRRRFSRDGTAKSDRIRLRKAAAGQSTPFAQFDVYARGLPVYQVAGSQNRRGVRAKGGRLYPGAFKTPKGMVFKRRGPRRTPLLVPKIGLRQKLEKAFTEIGLSQGTSAVYRREVQRLVAVEQRRFNR